MQSRAEWYARRLAAMSPAEMATRAWRAVLHRADAARPFSPPCLAPPVAAFAGLAERVRAAPAVPAWREAYEQAEAGRFGWFGVRWPVAAPPDWHLDPVSGRQWPLGFGPGIGYRQAAGFGDVKCTWELNRLQYLQPVAALACATGALSPAALVRRHVADWIERNPPWTGINWASGIEIGLRAVSLVIVAGLVPMDGAPGRRLAGSLAAHGRFLARYPSVGSSANNHGVAEALGLLAVAAALPHHPRSAAWAARARRALRRLERTLVLPDGSGAEQAVGYHCFTLEMLAFAGLLGVDVPRLETAGRFLRALTDSGGHAPAIGDDDESRVAWAPPGPERYALAMQPVLGQPPAADVAPGLRQALFGRAAEPMAEHAAFVHAPHGGLTILRQGRMQLVFDHGALGHLSIAAHGHADALAVWLSMDGRPLLVDAGTFRYHGAGAVRERLRGTLAHNTLAVADADQSRMAGPFNWAAKARCRVVAAEAGAVTAEHDGYLRRFGCLHRRTVAAAAAGFVIEDRLLGRGGSWPVSVGFLVAPDQAVRARNGGWEIGERLVMRHEGSLEGAAETAEVSPAMGVLCQTLRLRFRGRLAAGEPARFVLSGA